MFQCCRQRLDKRGSEHRAAETSSEDERQHNGCDLAHGVLLISCELQSLLFNLAGSSQSVAPAG